MTIEAELKRIADSLEAIREHLTASGSGRAGSGSPEKGETTKKAAPKAATPEAEEKAQVPTADDIRNALVNVVTATDKETALDLLAEFGVKTAGDVPEGDRVSFIKRSEEIVAEATK